MRASVTVVRSELSGERETRTITRRRRIRTIAPRTNLPMICVLNGVPVLRRGGGWKRCVEDGDTVTFVIRPLGRGGGSMVLKVLMMVALAAAAVATGGAAASLMGFVAGSMAATAATAAVGAAVFTAGSMALNALMGTPKPPGTLQFQAQAAPSPTYTLGAQGNRARIGEAVPEIFGRHLVYPDFAAEPYTEFAGNEQYLYQLFAIGAGEYEIEQLRIEDTAIENFPEVTHELIAPGATVSLFPVNVTTAAEVAGQELLTGTAVGPFIVNPAGSAANAIAVDVVAPRGLYYANDRGGLDPISTTFLVEARPVDDMGAPAGGWTTLGAHTLTNATATPQRQTYRYEVTPARHEVRVTRTDTKNTSSRAGHDILWTAARAYIPGGQSYPGVTVLAMRMRATNSLSAQSSRKINLVARRKLPAWNGTSWGTPTATRSIAWALAYICRTRLPDERYDLAWLAAKDATWTARGDTFDAVFDAQTTFGEALTLAARAGRAKWFQHGGVIRFFRDEPATLPVALFNARNTVRGSFRTEYLMSGDETADAVIVEYFDEATWTPQEVLCQLPGLGAEQPARLKLFGVLSRAQAWREGMYEAASNRYRRMMPSLTTEMEGFIPLPGDLVGLQRDRPGWGQSGDVLEYIPETRRLTLSEPLEWGTGTHYFGFRLRDGSFSGPWAATAGVMANQAVLAAWLDFLPDTGTDRERTSYVFGPSGSFYHQVRVIAPRPRSMERVELLFVNEDPAVHTADTGTAPPPSAAWNLPARITRPRVVGLHVTLGGTAGTPLLLVSWLPAPGADHYHVEWSYNNGTSWQRAGIASAPQASLPAQRGAVRVRVAGVGLAVGDWTEWTGDPFTAPPPDVHSFLISTQPDGTRQFDMAMPGTPPPDFAGYAIRYRLGTGWTDYWGELAPLHSGLLTAAPYETNQLAAGTYTFAVKGFDDSGNESQNAVFITAELPDPRMAGVLYSAYPHVQGWPGTRTNCVLDGDTGVLAAADTTTWTDLATWNDYTRWVLAPASSIAYEHPAIDMGAVLPFTPLVTALADGTQTIEEQHSDDDVSYSAWAMIGPIITTRYVRLRITVAGAFPRIAQMDIKLSGEAIQEDINDLNTAALAGPYRLGAGDVRLPLAKAYSVITQASVSALQNVGPGWSWVLVDKDTSVGPRIKIYNASNALADAVIDARIQGL